MPVTCQVEGLDKLAQSFQSLPGLIEAGVKLLPNPNPDNGVPATVYGLIWEWGRISCNPGPKTLWSTNPLGETRVMTKTAPHGWVRVNRERYLRIMKERFSQLHLNGVPPREWNRLLQTLLGVVASDCAELMAETAPIDTGNLRESIVPAETGDEILVAGGNAGFFFGYQETYMMPSEWI
jgi:hypothetical protein